MNHNRITNRLNLIHLDHDYCRKETKIPATSSSVSTHIETDLTTILKSVTVNKTTPQISSTITTSAAMSKPDQSKNNTKMKECLQDSDLKSSLPLSKANLSKMSATAALSTNQSRIHPPFQTVNSNSPKSTKQCQRETLKQTSDCNSPFIKNSHEDKPVNRTVRNMKTDLIRATNILKAQRTLNRPQTGQVQQMVSVLKNPLQPPSISQPSSSTSHLKETIVTTRNSSNIKIQNIIVQDIQPKHESTTKIVSPVNEETKRPRKMNLDEYRNRMKRQGESNRMHSPTVAVHTYHTATTTEPFKDSHGNPTWYDREFTTIFKTESQIKEENDRPKPIVRDIGIQTYETTFEISRQLTTDQDDDVILIDEVTSER